MNIGIDFGTTYSMFSTYDSAMDTLRAYNFGGSESVPSVVAVDAKGVLTAGLQAKTKVMNGNPKKTFQAFKMMLTENNENLLKAQNFTKEYTPQYIAGEFLKSHILQMLSTSSSKSVEEMVICVPEVWTTQKAIRNGKLDGRKILQEICGNIPEVQKVRIVSEPAAASAFFTYNYAKNHENTPYEGHLLIIDYGGGTLDLTLTEIHSVGSSTEIKVLFRTGEGENENGKIGNAGVAYMEHAVRLAISEAMHMAPEEIANDLQFRKAVYALETDLIAQISPINAKYANANLCKLYDAVDECGAVYEMLEENEEEFTEIGYMGEDIPVTYSQLARAYAVIVRPTLEKCVLEAQAEIEELRKKNDGVQNNLKVVLVGGFGRFILVQKQVEQLFHRSMTGDDTMFDCNLGQYQESAVSYGAALLASNIVTIKHTAPFSLGLCLADNTPRYAIVYREEMLPGQEFWITRPGTSVKLKLSNGSEAISHLVIGDKDVTKGIKLPLLPAMREKTGKVYSAMRAEFVKDFPDAPPNMMRHYLGFSMDESEIVSMLVRYYYGEKTGEVHSICLDDYRGMFGLAEAEDIGAAVKNGGNLA